MSEQYQPCLREVVQSIDDSLVDETIRARAATLQSHREAKIVTS